MKTQTDENGYVDPELSRDPNNPKFYRRDKRFLISINKDEDIKRDDYVEIIKSDGRVKLLKIQDEVLVGSNAKSKKRFFLFHDITNLDDAGYIHVRCVDRYRQANGKWTLPEEYDQ